MESEGWKMEPRVAKVARGKSRVYEDRPPGRAGTEGPDPGETKTVFSPRAGRDRARGPNILIDPHRACWHTSAF